MIYFKYNFIVVVVVSDAQTYSVQQHKLLTAMLDSFLLLICLSQSIVLTALCLCNDDDIVANTIEQIR